MTMTSILAVVRGVAGIAICAAAPCVAADACSPTPKEKVVVLECNALRAINSGKAEAMLPLLADDYWLLTSGGHFMPHPKPAMVRRWVAAASKGTRLSLLEVYKVQELNGLALVSGKMEERKRAEGPDQCMTRTFTDLWEQRGSNWLLVHTHESGEAEAACKG